MRSYLPDIIILLCDTLAANRMSMYGYPRCTSPAMERLCEEGGFTAFKYCFTSSPWTIPSHASLFSGLYPSQHGTTGETYERCIFQGKELALPALLSRLSYKTFAISSNPIINEKTFKAGFSHFLNIPWKFTAISDTLSLGGYLSKKKMWMEMRRDLLGSPFGKFPEVFLDYLFAFMKFRRGVTQYSFPYTQKALEILLRLWKRVSPPMFVFVNLMENHDKYIPPPPYRRRFGHYSDEEMQRQKWWKHFYEGDMTPREIEVAQALYDEEVLTVDQMVYRTVRRLEDLDRKRFEGAIIVVTSDHGEALGEWGHWGHMFSVFPETTRVPLLVKFPTGSLSKGEVSHMVMLQDIYSTLLEAAGETSFASSSSVTLLSKNRKYVLIENYWSRWCDLQKTVPKSDCFASIFPDKEDDHFWYVVEHGATGRFEVFKTHDFRHLLRIEEQVQQEIGEQHAAVKFNIKQLTSGVNLLHQEEEERIKVSLKQLGYL